MILKLKLCLKYASSMARLTLKVGAGLSLERLVVWGLESHGQAGNESSSEQPLSTVPNSTAYS